MRAYGGTILTEQTVLGGEENGSLPNPYSTKELPHRESIVRGIPPLLQRENSRTGRTEAVPSEPHGEHRQRPAVDSVIAKDKVQEPIPVLTVRRSKKRRNVDSGSARRSTS